MLSKTVFYIGFMIAAALGSTAMAQQAGQERDPFFGEGPRSLSTPTSPENNSWGRDPFVKPFEGTAALQARQAPERKLKGIIFGKSERIAIIGGEMVREGNMVGDQKLMAIRKRSIVLMNSSGSTEEVFLENFSVRK
jgi:hypothetical protein